MKPIITVFTPAYNRAYTLHLCYESLKRQTNKAFIWLIIDDGSTDNTKELVDKWRAEGSVPIRYHYQQNQGMHGAHNTAYRLIDTELNMCIDSDDYLADDAIYKIISFWKANGNNDYAGLVGLDAKFDGRVIGTRFPGKLNSATLIDLYGKYHVKGDKKLVYRTELTRRTPDYPLYPEEKYCPLAYKYILIDQLCPLLIMNEVLCHVEYLKDGSSLNIINQYKRNPKGFSIYREVSMKYNPSFIGRFKAAIHYVSSQIMIRNFLYIFKAPKKHLTFLATPFGILLYFYIQRTKKSTVMKVNEV